MKTQVTNKIFKTGLLLHTLFTHAHVSFPSNIVCLLDKNVPLAAVAGSSVTDTSAKSSTESYKSRKS
jgi:hypothetical protein